MHISLERSADALSSVKDVLTATASEYTQYWTTVSAIYFRFPRRGNHTFEREDILRSSIFLCGIDEANKFFHKTVFWFVVDSFRLNWFYAFCLLLYINKFNRRQLCCDATTIFNGVECCFILLYSEFKQSYWRNEKWQTFMWHSYLDYELKISSS